MGAELFKRQVLKKQKLKIKKVDAGKKIAKKGVKNTAKKVAKESGKKVAKELAKAVTLCEIDVFKRIMENICNKITDGGFFVCSLHTKTNSDDIFPTYDELYHMISDEMLFADFSLYVQSNNEECNFAFIAQKSGKHSVSVNDEKFINIWKKIKFEIRIHIIDARWRNQWFHCWEMYGIFIFKGNELFRKCWKDW